jgi:nitrite reductase/ring-hydroxylating ferredoxin subunit
VTRGSAEPLYGQSLPTPSGWFCLGTVAEFPTMKITTRRIAGSEVIVFHTSTGLAALDAYCPHLGAHLGKGGCVEDDAIRCPFHGFSFNASGTCTKTSYGGAPPRGLRARAYPVLVLHGLVLIWFQPRGREPSWRPPQPDMEGWSPFRLHRWTLRGHPQETTENSVDLGHFGVVHGYRNVQERAPARTSGPHLFTQYAFERNAIAVLGREVTTREVIDVHVWGLGYSIVAVTDMSFGLELRLLVLPTPLDAETIDLRIGLSVRDLSVSPRVPAPLRRLPRAMTRRLLSRALLWIYRGEVEQDFAIWRHKRYVDPPLLAPGDGPVGLYRRWVRQFYEDSRAADE